MALKTLGTNATTTLQAIVHKGVGFTVADSANIRAHILNDLINGNPVLPGAYGGGESGVLYVPNRGILYAQPGDYIAYDATGWPILVGAAAIASGSTSWTHS